MTDITISNVHDRGFAFAVTDTGKQVFIPPHTLAGNTLRAGDTIKAVLVVNPSDRSAHGTPWMAVRLEADDKEQVEEKTDEQTMEQRDQEVFEVISEAAYVTTSEIAEFLEIDTKTALNSAMRLYNAGRIGKADVYAKVGQQRPSFVLFTTDVKLFLEDV